MTEDWLKSAYSDTVPDDYHGETKWQSPSNIAIVKYWGKKNHQIPQNPSISFTLSKCHTETAVFYEKSDRFSLSFFFEGKENKAFGEKIETFLAENLSYFPFINQLDLRMESRNTFPHSSGIASSASSMSALVMCVLDIERQLKSSTGLDMQKASYFSRLASGSASRSVFPKMALWGKTVSVPESANEFAIPLMDEIHAIYKNYCDTILIVNDAQKSVSSRAGHALMESNPYAAVRYDTARRNVEDLLSVLANGDLETFVRITESEALQLHALMMCSQPSFILLKPNTLQIIDKVKRFREETKLPICFTLDAGPNVHLLYPDDCKGMVGKFIRESLLCYCADSMYINDYVGNGPTKL
jgi:diphosphomevalonate decarboxylase